MLSAMRFTRLPTDFHGLDQRTDVYSCSIVDPNSTNRPSTTLIFRLVVSEDKQRSMEKFFRGCGMEIGKQPEDLFEEYLFFKLCKEAIKRREGDGWRRSDKPCTVNVSNLSDLDDFVNDPSKQIAPPQGEEDVVEVPFEIEE